MPSHSTFILLDDILVIGSCQSEVVVLIANLNTTFALKDLGEINYFFGIQVKQKNFTQQIKYILDLLNKAKVLNAKGLNTPMTSVLKFSTIKGHPFQDVKLHRLLLVYFNM